MARKQTRSKNTKHSNSSTVGVRPAYGAKSAFVLALPPEMSAKEVIAKAESEGLVLTLAHVYNIRAYAKARLKKGKAPNAAPAWKAVTPKRQVPRPNMGAHADEAARMRKLIAEIGLTRARAVFAEVRQAFE